MRERVIAHRVLAPLLRWALRPPRGEGTRTASPGPVRILLLNAHGMGGTVRTVLNLAEHLAERYDVEIVSLSRRQDEAFFGLPPGVRVRVLHDRRPGAQRGWIPRLLARVPGVLSDPDDFAAQYYNLWSDLALLRLMRAWRTGVVITTRPALSLFAAMFGRPEVVVVAQEHANLSVYPEALRRAIGEHYRRLDVVTVLTATDLAGYERLLAGSATRLERIPNAVPRMPGEPAAEREKLVLAAGRLAAVKGFDLLIEAFARVAERHPDWRLLIQGYGAERPKLEAAIAAHRLDGRVELGRGAPQLGEVMARAGVFALSSRHEGFGMVLLEAMSKGMAIVAFDCPTGPRELIDDGRNGILVPAEDVPAFADALSRVIADVDLRRRLGTAALQTAQDYGMDAIGRRWEELLDAHGATRRA
jgi:glycosyltransferase involved in cell wall biosynthesis